MTKTLQAPPGYAALLKDIKERVRTAQVRAALAVNRELILLYRLGATFWTGKRLKAGVRKLSSGLPRISALSFPASKALARAT